jgi:23S rRNA pseudouridine2605 synthase
VEAVGVQVSRLIRVRWRRYSAAERPTARRLYTELDLAQTNYLRELVELTPETSPRSPLKKIVAG